MIYFQDNGEVKDFVHQHLEEKPECHFFPSFQIKSKVTFISESI